MNHAIYFTGYKEIQESKTSESRFFLLGLDPHIVFSSSAFDEQPFPSAKLLSQVHVDEFTMTPWEQLDPSLALSYFFNDREEFETFCVIEKEFRDQRRRECARRGVKSTQIPWLFDIEYCAPNVDELCEENESTENVDCSDDDEYVFL